MEFIMYHSLKKFEETKCAEAMHTHVNNIPEDLSDGSDSSDEDIIIDRTEEPSAKVNQQVSEDSHMDIDVTQQNDDRKFQYY